MTLFWRRLLDRQQPEWLATIRANAARCESLRAQTRKPKATGTLSETAALCLRALVHAVQPAIAIEIGTFIGTSALVLGAAGARVYTCDKDNAVFASVGRITAFQNTPSTDMLRTLAQQGDLAVDLWFFDGRIQDADLPWIDRFSTGRTVFAFDDFEGREKGVMNVRKLQPQLTRYRLEAPANVIDGDLVGRSTIAALVPEGWA